MRDCHFKNRLDQPKQNNCSAFISKVEQFFYSFWYLRIRLSYGIAGLIRYIYTYLHNHDIKSHNHESKST